MDAVENLDELKARVRKLSARAVNLKMELHDLSEELPANWASIPEVAGRVFEAFQQLHELRQRIAELGG